jgi:hypothetical protein
MEVNAMPKEYVVTLDGSPEDLQNALLEAAARLWPEYKHDE